MWKVSLWWINSKIHFGKLDGPRLARLNHLKVSHQLFNRKLVSGKYFPQRLVVFKVLTSQYTVNCNFHQLLSLGCTRLIGFIPGSYKAHLLTAHSLSPIENLPRMTTFVKCPVDCHCLATMMETKVLWLFTYKKFFVSP